jgi:hypothetical protein
MIQNPFDADSIMPEPPSLNDSENVYKFPSAEGYETVPEDFKPTAERPLPALRCTHERPDGSRCKKFGVRGTGFNGTPSMCFIHGGSLPNVKNKAEATLTAVRMRLVEYAPEALEGLIDLAQKPTTGDAIRLKAYTEVLDRAGIKGGMDITVEHKNEASASVEIMKKLQLMGERMGSDNKQKQEELEDLGEAEVAEPQED